MEYDVQPSGFDQVVVAIVLVAASQYSGGDYLDDVGDVPDNELMQYIEDFWGEFYLPEDPTGFWLVEGPDGDRSVASVWYYKKSYWSIRALEVGEGDGWFDEHPQAGSTFSTDGGTVKLIKKFDPNTL